MSESNHSGTTSMPSSKRAFDIVTDSLGKRYAAEKRFRIYGIVSIMLAIAFLLILLVSIVSKGLPAFTYTQVQLPITYDETVVDPEGGRDVDTLSRANYSALIKSSLRELFPEVTERSELRKLNKIVSSGADFLLRNRILENPDLIGTQEQVWLPVDDEVDTYLLLKDNEAFGTGRLSESQVSWVNRLIQDGKMENRFNRTFFTASDSREPESAGILGALVGSALTLLITLIISFPLGVAAAVYLEEFAPKNRWTDLIEVNINNLAAVPSIIFGLLGLAVFINFFGLPRSAPLVGGLVLSLMTLPTIIIASRASLKSVPPSIREGALGIGASKMQTVTHHVLPLALPGMMTGTIIGMAQALGETAPLLMIGMVAFIVEVPGGIFDSATVLPVQIYLWADSPERAFVALTSATIMVLLTFLILMNGLAVLLRKRFEKRW